MRSGELPSKYIFRTLNIINAFYKDITEKTLNRAFFNLKKK